MSISKLFRGNKSPGNSDAEQSEVESPTPTHEPFPGKTYYQGALDDLHHYFIRYALRYELKPFLKKMAQNRETIASSARLPATPDGRILIGQMSLYNRVIDEKYKKLLSHYNHQIFELKQLRYPTSQIEGMIEYLKTVEMEKRLTEFWQSNNQKESFRQLKQAFTTGVIRMKTLEDELESVQNLDEMKSFNLTEFEKIQDEIDEQKRFEEQS